MFARNKSGQGSLLEHDAADAGDGGREEWWAGKTSEWNEQRRCTRLGRHVLVGGAVTKVAREFEYSRGYPPEHQTAYVHATRYTASAQPCRADHSSCKADEYIRQRRGRIISHGEQHAIHYQKHNTGSNITLNRAGDRVQYIQSGLSKPRKEAEIPKIEADGIVSRRNVPRHTTHRRGNLVPTSKTRTSPLVHHNPPKPPQVVFQDHRRLPDGLCPSMPLTTARSSMSTACRSSLSLAASVRRILQQAQDDCACRHVCHTRVQPKVVPAVLAPVTDLVDHV